MNFSCAEKRHPKAHLYALFSQIAAALTKPDWWQARKKGCISVTGSQIRLWLGAAIVAIGVLTFLAGVVVTAVNSNSLDCFCHNFLKRLAWPRR